MKKDILLELNNVVTHYGELKALDNVDFQIDEGEKVALMGPNGAGKSTVLKAIFGLIPTTSGEVVWHNQKITPLPHEMVKRGVSFVPQGRRVFKHLTVKENLEVSGFILKNKSLIKEKMEEALKFFPDLKKKLNEKSGSLSGGQQQMLSIARGLMIDPKIILLDEPSLGLSPKLVKEVFQKIREINEDRKMAVVVVEHNIKSLLDFVDRAYLLDKGKVVACDKPTHIIESDMLEKVFLGKV
jgi:branched-chain amino acid transport system ATP-binding protein